MNIFALLPTNSTSMTYVWLY